ncbi:MAG TPA: hypothetical protein VGB79_13365 [Allosphingosinicella sp.]|jgi:hypothetical protein
MAVQDQNDARGTARILAGEAMRSIEACEATSAASRVALSGLFRLLKAYRAHQLSGFEYQPRRDHAYEGMSIAPGGESHVGELRLALERALTEVYGQKPDEGLNAIERVIRAVAVEARPDTAELTQTTRFLGCFLQKL